MMLRGVIATSATLSSLALGVLAPVSASAEDKHCANVQFRSPFTLKRAQARVAIRRGNVSCATARKVIKKALSDGTRTSSGLTEHWVADGWRCSTAGDGTHTYCTRPGREVAATTPTNGGVWSEP
jgi:hypothetical protein